MASLYEITGQFKQLMDMADEMNLTQADIADTLEGLDLEFQEKAEAYAKVIRSLEADVAAIDKETKRLSDKKRYINNNIKAMKTNLEKAMIETGNRKFKTSLFDFGIQKNPPSVKVTDEKAALKIYGIPQPAKLDRKSMISDLKEGKELSFAELVQTEGLRIR